METNCEGCAGCCIDWRPLADDGANTNRRGRRPPLDDVDNLVPLSRDEIATFIDRGEGDALAPRLFEPADGDDSVTVDGIKLAAIGDRPVFVVGLRKPPKPVAPFDVETQWLDTCVFLDPDTLQCRVHGEDRYPETCAVYPGHNLRLGAETECERVEAEFDEERLRDDSVPVDLPPPQFGPGAVGSTVFAYPDPDDLTGSVKRAVDAEMTDDDRALFAGAAVSHHPGSLSVNSERMRQAAADVRNADSWIGKAVREWTELAARDTNVDVDCDDVNVNDNSDDTTVDGDCDSTVADLVRRVEEDRGAPPTAGW